MRCGATPASSAISTSPIAAWCGTATRPPTERGARPRGRGLPDAGPRPTIEGTPARSAHVLEGARLRMVRAGSWLCALLGALLAPLAAHAVTLPLDFVADNLTPGDRFTLPTAVA